MLIQPLAQPLEVVGWSGFSVVVLVLAEADEVGSGGGEDVLDMRLGQPSVAAVTQSVGSAFRSPRLGGCWRGGPGRGGRLPGGRVRPAAAAGLIAKGITREAAGLAELAALDAVDGGNRVDTLPKLHQTLEDAAVLAAMDPDRPPVVVIHIDDPHE